MKKQYTEQQYKVFCDYMDRIANEDYIPANFEIYLEFKTWKENNDITVDIEDEMGERLEEEEKSNQ